MVAPVLFLFVFGIIEIGRMLMVRQALTNAAREGCRKARKIPTSNCKNRTSTTAICAPIPIWATPPR